jgi:hypothetical protein
MKHGIDVIPFDRFNDDIDDSSLFKRMSVVAIRPGHRQPIVIYHMIRERHPDIAHFHNTFPRDSPAPMQHVATTVCLLCRPSTISDLSARALYRDGRP